MKLCITATGNTLEANTDSSFGRAPWLLVVDTDTLAFEAIENSGVNASQGAGIAAAQIISDKGADGLLTGKVGPKAQAALEASGVNFYEGLANSSVKEAVSQFNDGAYPQSGEGVSQAKQETGTRPESGTCKRDGSGKGRGGGSGMGRGGGGRCRSGQGSGQRGGM